MNWPIAFANQTVLLNVIGRFEIQYCIFGQATWNLQYRYCCEITSHTLPLYMVCSQYVESGKPLISRHRSKPKETPCSPSNLFGADHKEGMQCESSHYQQQLEREEREPGSRSKQLSHYNINVSVHRHILAQYSVQYIVVAELMVSGHVS